MTVYHNISTTQTFNIHTKYYKIILKCWCIISKRS